MTTGKELKVYIVDKRGRVWVRKIDKSAWDFNGKFFAVKVSGKMRDMVSKNQPSEFSEYVGFADKDELEKYLYKLREEYDRQKVAGLFICGC